MTADAKFWDRMAAKYAKSPIADMDSYNYTLERTRSYLRDTDHVLELGCGTGSTALLLAADVAKITASDLSPNMIEIARSKASAEGITNVEFIIGEVQEDSIPDGPYDVVTAFNLLHLVEDLEGSLARIHKMTKPGGHFISKTVCAFGKGVTLKHRLMKMALPLMQLVGLAPFVALRPIADHEQMIMDAGFEIIETGNYPASPPSRYVVARKV